MSMRIDVIPVTQYAQNCMLIAPEEGGPAVLVDPGGDFGRIAEAIDLRNARVEGILLTHGHIDHIGAVPEATEATGAPVWVHPDDLWLFDDPGMGRWPAPSIRIPKDTRHVLDGDTVDMAGITFGVLFTPGHSPGHVSYLLEGFDRPILIAGDLLFAGSIGRTDLPGSDFETLARSVEEKLWPLPDETAVLPGHGPATEIGHEKRTNPFVGVHMLGGHR